MDIVVLFRIKKREPIQKFKNAQDSAPPAGDFVGALRAANLRTRIPSLIAEVKKTSPSR